MLARLEHLVPARRHGGLRTNAALRGERPIFVRHLVDTLGRVAVRVPPDRRGPLVEQAEAALRAAQDKLNDPDERTRVKRSGERVFARLVRVDTERCTSPDGELTTQTTVQ